MHPNVVNNNQNTSRSLFRIFGAQEFCYANDSRNPSSTGAPKAIGLCFPKGQLHSAESQVFCVEDSAPPGNVDDENYALKC